VPQLINKLYQGTFYTPRNAFNNQQNSKMMSHTSHPDRKPNPVVDQTSSRRPFEHFFVCPNVIDHGHHDPESMRNGCGYLLSFYGHGVFACKYTDLQVRSKHLPRWSYDHHL